MSTSPEKRNRERERLRRKPVEPAEELPSFPEPRRINVERQDSLSNKIQAVLGHMGKIHNLIGKDPNVWLGTSRNASVNKNNSSSAATDNKDKDVHTKSQVSGHHNQRPKQQASTRQYPVGTSSSSYPTKPSLAYSSNSNTGGDHFRLDSNKSSHFNHSSDQRQLKDGSPGSKGHNTTQKVHGPSPNQISNAEELPSLDMPGAMESIFQEMKMNEPLSEIQTPCPSNGQEFNFSKNEAKADLHSGSNEHMADEATENSDDSDTSDDDDSETDESDHESPSSKVNWSLTEFMPEYQKSAENPVIDTDADNDKHGRTTNTYRDQQEETQSFQKSSTRGRLSQKDASESQNRTAQFKATSAKDGEDRKKASEERPRGRNRPASVSSFGSASPVRHHTPTDVSRSSDTLRVPRDSSQEFRFKERVHKTSQSKSCSPVPRNYENSRSNTNPKHQKRFSPQRSSSKSHNTVRTKEINSIPSPSADYSTSSVIPSSVRNETLPSSQPTPRTHQRTANKKSSASSGRHSGRVAEKTATITTSPVKASLSDSDSSSDDDDEHSVSFVSSSSSSEEEFPSHREDDHPPSRSAPWNANVTHQSNPTVPKLSTKRKTHDPRARGVAMEHMEGHYGDNNVPLPKKSRKQFELKYSNSHPCSQQTNVNQPFNTDKDSSKTNSGSPSVTAALIKNERKYRNSPRQHQQYQSVPRIKEPNRYPPLWVKLPTSRPNLSAVVELCNMKTPTQHLSRSEVDGKGKKLENDLLPSKSASKFDNTQSTMACSAAASTGSQSLIPDDMIPSRRADSVQVAVAASTSELSPNSQSALQKRKLPKQSSTYSTNPPSRSPIPNHKAKRRKQDCASPSYQEGDSMQTLPSKQPKKHGQVKTVRKMQSNTPSGSQRWQQANDQSTSGSSQQSNSSNGSQNSLKTTKVDPNKPHHSNSQSSDITAGPADSSWPENETRIKTSDHYMREGKRLKHEGDACTDSRTGRTRAGEALNRALIYYEAALCFIMNGYTLELETANDRTESSHLSSNMYMQTIQLMDYIRKMRPHDHQEECTFKRLKISCLRSQALLYLGIYKLKKDAAFKCSEVIVETLKPSKSNRTPSPWNVVNGQNVVSPVSPAVPSPYGGNVAGPSPVAGAYNTCEQVTSSTQVNKMASPPSQNGIVLPPKVADVFRQFHNVAMNVMQAHEKWDQAVLLLPEHKDFFRHVDVLTAHELKMNSSLRDLATYNKVILRQLRGAYKSPQE